MPSLPLSLPGANTMPMSQTTQLPIDSSQLIAGQAMRMPTASPPPPSAAGMIQGPNGAPVGAPQGFPAPGQPQKPPYDVVMQPDGSSVYVAQTAGGPVTLAVNKPPVLPKALQQPQAPTPASMAQPGAQ